VEEIDELFGGLQDPRSGIVRLYSLHAILLYHPLLGFVRRGRLFGHGIVLALQVGFLGQLLKIENGVPSHDTFSRVLRLLTPSGSIFDSSITFSSFPRLARWSL
jgi:hypothetical protein